MSQVDESSNGEFATAIAAATYAINCLGSEGEKEGSMNKKKPVDGLRATLSKTKSKDEHSSAKPIESNRISRWFSGQEEKESAGKFPSFRVSDGRADGLQPALTKTKSKKESSTAKPTDPGGVSRWFSGMEGKEDEGSAGEMLAGNLEAREKKMLEDQTVNQKSGKEIDTFPSIKKTRTSTDKHQNEMGSKRFASEKGKTTGQNASTSMKTTRASLTGDQKLDFATTGQKETKADAWETAEIDKIKRRYEKLYSRILEWEDEKKKKAKRRSERKERKLELRRAIALQEYRDEIARIDKIVAGARAAADEKKRNDEHKTMEKANEIRSTGKIPHSCFGI